MKTSQKLKHIIRDIMPYGIARWYQTRKLKKTSISFGQFQQRFEEVAYKLEDNDRFKCDWSDRQPCLNDANTNTPFEPHYIYHPAWAARILAKTKPVEHVDISSSLHFVVIVSGFIPIKFYDYRPATLNLENLHCGHVDITKLPFEDDSIASLSCMHVIEHIGLERYGDLFDPQGDIKGMKELARVLERGGQLLFVVPVAAKARIDYNAHRVYRYADILSAFTELRLESFSLVTDGGMFITPATKADADKQQWGCGCFHFRKYA